MRHSCLFVATLLLPALAGADSDAFEHSSEQLFETLEPTGMAVAVIRRGQLAMLRGYGRLVDGEPETVDPDTVFPIHSMTKSFTAATLALLVDEGKVAWSDPVRKHISEFEMSDPYVSTHLTVRDLLVHDSGLALGAGDLLLWPDARATAKDVLAALPYLPLATGFREGFTYDNILYFVAGEVVARASGTTWADFVERRLFEPLGMNSCSASGETAKPVPTALQHARSAGGEPVPLRRLTLGADPSGSISCSVRDIAKWALFQMGDGRLPDGSRLLMPERMQEMHQPVVPLRQAGSLRRLAGSRLANYALGWFVFDFAGTLAVEHGGTGPGGQTDMILLPDLDSAAVVLTNDMVPAQRLSYLLADRLVRGDEAADWIGFLAALQKRRRESAPDVVEVVRPEDPAPPTLALSAYAGTYRDPWYGDIRVAETDDGLEIHLMRSKLLSGPLLPWDGETFVARWPNRGLEADALISFVHGADGAVTAMEARALSPATDFSYDYQDLHPVRVSD